MEKQKRRKKDFLCPQCNSADIEFDEVYGFYTCNTCGHVWGYAEDDPDFDELDDLDEYTRKMTLIAMSLISIWNG